MEKHSKGFRCPRCKARKTTKQSKCKSCGSTQSNLKVLNYKNKALEFLPELEQEITKTENAMAAWIEVNNAFEEGYKKKDPIRINKVLQYARWCLDHLDQLPKGVKDSDMLTTITVCFFEHIPTVKEAWPDIPKYFSEKTFREGKKIFAYHLSESEYSEILELYKKTKYKGRGILD